MSESSGGSPRDRSREPPETQSRGRRSRSRSSSAARSESSGADSFRFSPAEFSSSHLFKIDFKYLEKCIAFLVRSEQEHKTRIAALEIRQGSEHALVAELDATQQQQTPQLEALSLALPRLSGGLDSISAQVAAAREREASDRQGAEQRLETLSLKVGSLGEDLKLLSSNMKGEISALASSIEAQLREQAAAREDKISALASSTAAQLREQALGNARAGHADADMIALQQRVTEQLQQQDDKILALDKQSESHRDHASQTREEITMLHRKMEELRALTSSSTVTPPPPAAAAVPPHPADEAVPPASDWRTLSTDDMSEELRRAVWNTKQAASALRPPGDIKLSCVTSCPFVTTKFVSRKTINSVIIIYTYGMLIRAGYVRMCTRGGVDA